MEEGKLTISRPVSNITGDYIKIHLTDKKYKHLIHIEIELKEFAQALTGLGNIKCEYKTFSSPVRDEPTPTTAG